jgi:hypothetical protein
MRTTTVTGIVTAQNIQNCPETRSPPSSEAVEKKGDMLNIA